MTKTKFTTILAELYEADKKDANYIIKSRAENIIGTAINFIELLETKFPDKAEALEKKFLSAIKNRDSSKFTKSIGKTIEEDSLDATDGEE